MKCIGVVSILAFYSYFLKVQIVPKIKWKRQLFKTQPADKIPMYNFTNFTDTLPIENMLPKEGLTGTVHLNLMRSIRSLIFVGKVLTQRLILNF